MKQTFKQAFGIALLCSAVAISSLSAGPLESNVANFVPRSPGDYLFMEMGLGADKMHMKDKEEMYGNFSVNARYDRSFRGERLAEGLFGSDSAGVLNFKGSGVSGRSDTLDLVAENFGLGESYVGKVTFDPRVTRFVADFNFHLGLDEWFEGLYFMVNAPLAYEKWEAKAVASDITADTTHAAGLMDLLTSATTPLSSVATALIGASDFGDKTEDQKWQKIQMDGKEANSSQFALADVDAQIGYNFIRKDDCVLGIFGNVVAPTGNEPDNKEAFEPRVGAKNWQVGGGAHFYKNLHDKDDSNFAVRAGAKVVTGLKNKEKRTFDFVDYGKMSRYLLLKKFTLSGSTYSYDNALVSGVNVSTRDVDVKFDILADVFGQVEYRKDNYGFDLGYNFYYKSKEKISNASAASASIYAVKGAQPVGNGTGAASTDALIDYAVSSGTSIVKSKAATAGDDMAAAGNLSDNAKLDLVGNPSQASHSVYGMANYRWNDNEWAPYVGFGGKGEFSASNNANKKGVLNIWSVMVQGGLHF